MNTVFTIGQAMNLDPRNSNFVILYDRHFLVSAIFTGEIRMGAWYNVYKMHGHYMVGTEVRVNA